MPKTAHGSENIGRQTSSTREIMDAAMRLYDRIADRELMIRRMYVAANHVKDQNTVRAEQDYEQLDMFSVLPDEVQRREKEESDLAREAKLQQSILSIRGKYGKNALLRGTSYQEGATGRERNQQIGGHKA